MYIEFTRAIAKTVGYTSNYPLNLEVTPQLTRPQGFVIYSILPVEVKNGSLARFIEISLGGSAQPM